jgi:Uma2 family endonuclease
MYVPLIQSSMSFAEFLAWDDGHGQAFELRDGFPMPIVDPNAKHEDVADELCEQLARYCKTYQLPYVAKRQKQVMMEKNPLSGRESSRRSDIVVFAKSEWDRMRQSSSSAAAYVPPPLVIEVVSTNWRDDYEYKLNEYEALGIAEYWIVDYAALGGIRYIGKPKQPTLTVYQLVNCDACDGDRNREESREYQGRAFRGRDRIESLIFPDLTLTADQIFAAGWEIETP